VGESISIPVTSRDHPFVAGAAARLQAFWPAACVISDAGGVTLSSLVYDSAKLASIWQCALLNERLVVDNAVRRSRVWAELVA
jgi:hypothetical protein